MMESTAFFNAKAGSGELTLFLDINPKNDTIKEFFYDGTKAQHFSDELDELKVLVIGKSIDDAKHIHRYSLGLETKLENGELPVIPRGLTLLREAITSYTGEGRTLNDQSDLLCLCFAVTKKDIVAKVLANKNFELKTLIQETMASSACGSCRPQIEKLIVETRLEHGLIKGLDHSKSRFDKDGHWVKVAGLYPGPLLLKLEGLKIDWMKREGITEQYTIEFMDIEGHHLSVKINSTNEKTVQGLLLALSDYLKSETGTLFFLTAV